MQWKGNKQIPPCKQTGLLAGILHILVQLILASQIILVPEISF